MPRCWPKPRETDVERGENTIETEKEMTELQKLAKLEEEGPFSAPEYSDAERKRIKGAAKQWANKTFVPYSFSSAMAADE